MSADVKQDAEKRMKKAVENLKLDFTKVRTGRANPALLDNVQVDYYGNLTSLSQIANVSASDSRTLLVTPWEKNMVPAVEKAILNSDLGLNPSTSGNAIRVPMPALTEERRKDLIKVIKAEGEQARVSVRNIRRDANGALKERTKNKMISEDEERKATDAIQKLTNKHIAEIDSAIVDKEKDLMAI